MTSNTGPTKTSSAMLSFPPSGYWKMRSLLEGAVEKVFVEPHAENPLSAQSSMLSQPEVEAVSLSYSVFVIRGTDLGTLPEVVVEGELNQILSTEFTDGVRQPPADESVSSEGDRVDCLRAGRLDNPFVLSGEVALPSIPNPFRPGTTGEGTESGSCTFGGGGRGLFS